MSARTMKEVRDREVSEKRSSTGYLALFKAACIVLQDCMKLLGINSYMKPDLESTDISNVEWLIFYI